MCTFTLPKQKQNHKQTNTKYISLRIREKYKQKIQNIIPSAGEGSRHKHLGYNLPKPLIPISKKMMFERSLESLPSNKNNLFIFKKKTFLKNNLQKKSKNF